MQGGNISNEAPASIYVNLDILLNRKPEVQRVLGLFPSVREALEIDLLTAADLNRIASKSAVSWVGFAVGMEDHDVNYLIDALDRTGLNPFRWVTRYDDYSDLLKELPFVKTLGVLDRQERALTFGSYYIDMDKVHGR